MNNETNGAIKSPQDFAAGLVMVALGLAAYKFASPLPMGKGANLGPGSFPVGVSLFIVTIGALIAFNGWRSVGERLDWRFVRMLGVLAFLATSFVLFEAMFNGILNNFGISSKKIPWSTFLPAMVVIGMIFYITELARRNEDVNRWVMRGPIFILSAICMFALLVRPVGLVVAAPVLISLAANAQDEPIDWREIGIFTLVMTTLCVLLFRVALGQPIPIAPWAGY